MRRSLAALSASLLLSTAFVGAVYANVTPHTRMVAASESSHPSKHKSTHQKQTLEKSIHHPLKQPPKVSGNQDITPMSAPAPSTWTSVVKEQPAVLLEPDGTESEDAPAGALYTDSDDVG